MSPKAKSAADKLLVKGAKIALVGAPAGQRELFDPAEISRDAKTADTDLNRDTLWPLLEKKGFEGVRLVALDDTGSAMMFRRAAKA